jgi:hypothetical protein
MTIRDVHRMREARANGMTRKEAAAVFGCGLSTVDRYAPGRAGMIANDDLRTAFVRSAVSASDVARALGWHGRSGSGAQRVRKAVGLEDDRSTGGYRKRRATIHRDLAARIADAIGVDPWAIGAGERVRLRP